MNKQYFLQVSEAEAELLLHLLHKANFTHFQNDTQEASVLLVIKKLEHALQQ